MKCFRNSIQGSQQRRGAPADRPAVACSNRRVYKGSGGRCSCCTSSKVCSTTEGSRAEHSAGSESRRGTLRGLVHSGGRRLGGPAAWLQGSRRPKRVRSRTAHWGAAQPSRVWVSLKWKVPRKSLPARKRGYLRGGRQQQNGLHARAAHPLLRPLARQAAAGLLTRTRRRPTCAGRAHPLAQTSAAPSRRWPRGRPETASRGRLRPPGAAQVGAGMRRRGGEHAMPGLEWGKN